MAQIHDLIQNEAHQFANFFGIEPTCIYLGEAEIEALFEFAVAKYNDSVERYGDLQRLFINKLEQYERLKKESFWQFFKRKYFKKEKQ